MLVQQSRQDFRMPWLETKETAICRLSYSVYSKKSEHSVSLHSKWENLEIRTFQEKNTFSFIFLLPMWPWNLPPAYKIWHDSQNSTEVNIMPKLNNLTCIVSEKTPNCFKYVQMHPVSTATRFLLLSFSMDVKARTVHCWYIYPVAVHVWNLGVFMFYGF